MKIALITDTHWGARNDSDVFADYFGKFYKEIFFPYLQKNKITHIIHLGDIVDRRKYINFVTAKNLRDGFILPCFEMGVHLDVIIGNHDVYYKNTNQVNAMSELGYPYWYEDMTVHTVATVKSYDGVHIVLMPWINETNNEIATRVIDQTNAKILMGHLELSGYEMYKGAVIDHGQDAKLYSKFSTVCSGHFHHKSSKGNINYLGAPYEITWSDYDDQRGFHVFDTVTSKLEYIINPLRMFHKLVYSDNEKNMEDVLKINMEKYRGCYVQVMVEMKTNPYWFDLYVDKLTTIAANVKIVSDHSKLNVDGKELLSDDVEDTITIMKRYVSLTGVHEDQKVSLGTLMTDLYAEACAIK